ncbi:MAG: ABC transporter substrate-binding protein [Thermodesulfobacteriota bacterium]|nr:ABC transporter substrate-binding protein [Thermodesulfobacteriota bacterium]
MWMVKTFIPLEKFYVLAIFFLLFSISVNAGTLYGEEVTGVTDNSVKIGLMGALTGIGADSWIPLADGARAFFKMVNDGGGVHGRKIKYILEDDRYTIPLALSCFKKLVYKDRIFALQAASGVGHTAALIPLVEKEKIPLIAATGEKKFFMPTRKYIFSLIPWYEDQAKLIVEYIFSDLRLKRPAFVLLYPDTASGKDTREAVRRLVKEYPVKKYKEIAFSISALDYTSEALVLKRFKPDFIFVHGYVSDTASIVKAANMLKVAAPIMVSQYACVDEVLKIAGKAAKSLLGINCFGTWADDSPGAEELRKASLAYDPNVNRRSPNFFQGWFLGMIFREGLKNAGRDVNRETFLEGLEAIKDFDTEGICGVITFGPDDHKSIDSHRFYKTDTEKKRFVAIGGWRKPKE